MPARSTLMRLQNRTPHTLTRTEHRLVDGEWTKPNEAPPVISPGQTVFIQSESDGIATGTEGIVRYASSGGGELWFHWDNPFLGVNSYRQGAPSECGLAFSGGTGNNAVLDLYLVTSAQVSIPNFTPAENGFLFSNTAWPHLPLIEVPLTPFEDITVADAANGLCGGMSYAVADYYLAGVVPPRSPQHPNGIGDPLFDHIVRRQIDSFDLPFGPLEYWKYMNPAYPETPGIDAVGRNWVMAHESLPHVMASIDAGRPCPLSVVMILSLSPTDLGDNHQILAYGFTLDGDRAVIWVYDPNFPGTAGHLISFDVSDSSKDSVVAHNVSTGGTLHAFFPTPYEPQPPPLPPPPPPLKRALDAFWIGDDSAVATNWADHQWHEPFPITSPGAARADSPIVVVTRPDDALDAYWIGTDGAVATNWGNPHMDEGKWHTPFPISPPGAAALGSRLVAVTRNRALDVLWVAPDGAVTTNWANPDLADPRWHDPFTITPPGFARHDSGLAVVVRGWALDAYWIGVDGAVATTWTNVDVDNGIWHTPFPISGAGAAGAGSSLAAVARNQALDVYWIAPDGAVTTNWVKPDVDGAQWHQPFTITPPGAARADSDLAVVVRGEGLDVFWVGPDGAVATTWTNVGVDNGIWHTPFTISPPGAAGPGSLAALTRLEAALEVYWIGADGAVVTNWANPTLDNPNWHDPFLIAQPGSARANSPVAAVVR